MAKLKASAFWLFLCFLLLPFAASSQLSVNFTTKVTCHSTDILVPITTTGFNDVGALTLLINYDTNDVRLIGLENPNALFAGGMVLCKLISYPAPGISISWYRNTPINLGSGKLFDLHFTLLDSSAYFAFDSTCEIAHSDLSVIDSIQYNNGFITYLEKLDEQPQSVKVAEQTDAQFTVNQHNDLAYRWQVLTSGIWVDLINSLPYSDVLTNKMRIHSVPYSLNNSRYRCALTLDDCTYYSGDAYLQVSGLSVPEKKNQGVEFFTVFPNPAHGILHVTSNKSLNQLTFQLSDLEGRILFTSFQYDIKMGETTDLDLHAFAPGIYILQVLDQRQKLIEMQKIELQ